MNLPHEGGAVFQMERYGASLPKQDQPAGKQMNQRSGPGCPWLLISEPLSLIRPNYIHAAMSVIHTIERM
jgi:hypothetical protein